MTNYIHKKYSYYRLFLKLITWKIVKINKNRILNQDDPSFVDIYTQAGLKPMTISAGGILGVD